MRLVKAVCVLGILAFCISASYSEDPLASWNKGDAKSSIINFVKSSTKKSSKTFIPESERIVVFDNDGTLWSEQPFYFQLQFAIDRIKELAPKHPEWKTEQPFKAVLEDDKKTLIGSGKKGLLELVMASHAGMTTDEFEAIVQKWLKTARHPRFNKPFNELVFQPMLELLDYLRANGFTTYICSGGGIEFLRVWAEEAYGIPPENIIGSSIKTEFNFSGSKPKIVRIPEMNFINDKKGKPVSINQFIGRVPVGAFGNSDGDLQMLQWSTVGRPNTFGLIVRHDDKEREWAYDRDSHIGRLDKALDQAQKHNWTVVSMKKDWKVIYPFQKPANN